MGLGFKTWESGFTAWLFSFQSTLDIKTLERQPKPRPIGNRRQRFRVEPPFLGSLIMISLYTS